MKKFLVALALTASFFLASISGAADVPAPKTADNTVKTAPAKAKQAKKVKKAKTQKKATKPVAVDNTVKK